MTYGSQIPDVPEAMLYDKLPHGRVRCSLCEHRCVIADGETGICGVLENRGGTLHTLVYGRTIIQQADPIEKKPLFHFHPGTSAYSVAVSVWPLAFSGQHAGGLSSHLTADDLQAGVDEVA
ncbi:hypothetical protein JXA47_06765, partial [Candidatus Sumerlaeota bacterium]|nr:hypothetical protein [Candidatus Sumerlaeota bacterium]